MGPGELRCGLVAPKNKVYEAQGGGQELLGIPLALPPAHLRRASESFTSLRVGWPDRTGATGELKSLGRPRAPPPPTLNRAWGGEVETAYGQGSATIWGTGLCDEVRAEHAPGKGAKIKSPRSPPQKATAVYSGSKAGGLLEVLISTPLSRAARGSAMIGR